MELSPERYSAIKELGEKLNIEISPAEAVIFNCALTHSSYVNEHGLNFTEANQRLEFLGDSVLGLLISERLYHKYPQSPEGELSKAKSVIVSKKVLSSVSSNLELGQYLLLGKGEEASGGRTRESILGDAMESILGAIYICFGLDTVRELVLKLLDSEIDRVTNEDAYRDHKSELQEASQRLLNSIPKYKVIRTEGPDHDKVFQVEVRLKDEILGRGMGKSKKIAEQCAAKEAILHWEKRYYHDSSS